MVELGAHALGLQLRDDLAEVVGVLLGDRDADDLHRRQPHRERAGVVLQQDREEPLDRPEQGAVDHDRPLLLAVAVGVLELEPLGQVRVDLHGGQLPGAADRILRLRSIFGP